MNWFKNIVESVVARMAAPMIEAAVAKAIADRNTAVSDEINLVAETLTAASVAEKVDAKAVAAHLRDVIDLSDLNLTAKDIARALYVRDIASEIDLDDLKDYINLDNIEVDYGRLAQEIDASDVASDMNLPDLASEISLNDLAGEIDLDDLAEKINYRALALAAIEIAAGR